MQSMRTGQGQPLPPMSDLSQLFTCVQPTCPARAADAERAAVANDVGATVRNAGQFLSTQRASKERVFRHRKGSAKRMDRSAPSQSCGRSIPHPTSPEPDLWPASRDLTFTLDHARFLRKPEGHPESLVTYFREFRSAIYMFDVRSLRSNRI